MGGPSQASTTLGLTAKMWIYCSNRSSTFSFSAGLVWPVLASRRSATGVSSSSTSLFSPCCFGLPLFRGCGWGSRRDWIRGGSKLFTLYAVAMGVPLDKKRSDVGRLNVWFLYHCKLDIRPELATVDSCVLDRVKQGGCCLQNNSFSLRRCGTERRRDGDCMRLTIGVRNRSRQT